MGNRTNMENKDLKIVSKKGAVITGLYLRHMKFNFLGEPWMRSPVEIRVWGQEIPLVKQEKKGNSLVITRENSELGVRLEEKLSLNHGTLDWQMEVINLVHFGKELDLTFSMVVNGAGWRYWLPGAMHEEELNGGVESEYRGGWGVKKKIGIPMCHLFNLSKKAGIGFLVSLEQKIPGLSFEFLDHADTEVKISFNHLLLAPLGRKTIALQIRPHEGNWEDFWSWFAKKNQKLLCPHDDRISQVNGSWLYLGSRTNTGKLSVMKKSKRWSLEERVKAYQIHCYFPFYGKYCLKENSWEDLNGEMVTTDEIRQVIKHCHDHKIKVFVYADICECQYRYAEENFPDSIAMDYNGKPIRAWWMEDSEREQLFLMNSDPAYSFGQHLLDQIKGLMKRFKEADGIFLDRADYVSIEYGHHDGYTMSKGKPAYQVAFGIERFLKKAAELIHDHGKFVVINALSCIDVAKFADGLTLDAYSWWAKQTRFMGWNKPFWWLPGVVTKERMETAIEWRMFLGAGEKSEEIFKKYRDKLYGFPDK